MKYWSAGASGSGSCGVWLIQLNGTIYILCLYDAFHGSLELHYLWCLGKPCSVNSHFSSSSSSSSSSSFVVYFVVSRIQR